MRQITLPTSDLSLTTIKAIQTDIARYAHLERYRTIWNALVAERYEREARGEKDDDR